MRIVMMGTGPFAVPTFHALMEAPHDVAAVVTRPEAQPRRGQAATSSPMRAAAQQRNLPIIDPSDVNSVAMREMLAALEPQLLVVCDYGQILSAETLTTATLGGINLHASLLPAYRGAAPINWALLRGETRTGVTVIHMTPQLDAGPCLVQRATEIGPTEDAIQLELRLSQLGVEAVLEAVDMLQRWDRQSSLGAPQQQHLASRAPRLKKSDGQVDWNWPSARIVDHVRAMKPWPGSFTSFRHADRPSQRLILHQVSLPGEERTERPPGEVALADERQLWVAAGDARPVKLEVIQPAGKRAMEIQEFLRGHPLRIGDRFGPP